MSLNIINSFVSSRIKRSMENAKDDRIKHIVFACTYPILWINDAINTQCFLLSEEVVGKKDYRHDKKRYHKFIASEAKKCEKNSNSLASNPQSEIVLSDYYSFLDQKMQNDMEILKLQVYNFCTRNSIPQSEDLVHAIMADILCQFQKDVKKVFEKLVSEELGIPYAFTSLLSIDKLQLQILRYIKLFNSNFDYVDDKHIITCTKIFYNKITSPAIFIDAMAYSDSFNNKQTLN